jgi:hypothetical protein
MPASTSSVAPDNSTDAGFRAWVAAFIAAMTVSGGMVQTADSGQINTSTVTRPLAINTFQGYAVFRSNDAAGSLVNFYIRADFGSGASSAGLPAIKFSFGWGTDGAGNINSTNKITGSSSSTVSAASASTTAMQSNFSVGPGWVAINIFDAVSGTSFMKISIERTRDKNGSEQNEIAYWCYGSNNGFQGVLPQTGVIPTQITVNAQYGVCTIDSSVAQYDGSNYGVGTYRPIKGGFCMDSANLFFGNSTHFSAPQMQYIFNVYGSNHTYIAGSNASQPSAISGVRVLMRYE